MIPIVVLDVIGLAGGCWVVWRNPTPSRGQDCVRLATWALGLALASTAVGLALGSGFAVLRLWCHVLFCVLAPLLILRGIWRMRTPSGRAFGMALLALGLAMDGVYYYARRIEPLALETTTHELRLPQLAGMPGRLRVVLLADLQTDDAGSYEAGVLAQIDTLRPDLLLLAGDYVQVRDAAAYMEQQSRVLKLVRRMTHRPRLGAYAVMGDTDRDTSFFAGTHVQMLTGDVIKLDDVPVQVFGLAYRDTFGPLQPHHWQTIKDFKGLTIALGHRPDYMLDVVHEGAPAPLLALAGHTHGGQIVVPGFGAPITLSKLPRRYASGLHRFDGDAWLCVSRGVGMERLDAPRIRFLCPPQLVVLDLFAPN